MMSKVRLIRHLAFLISLSGITLASSPSAAFADAAPPASNSTSVVQSLLDKARAMEARGRMDLAAQTWQQVLLTDPNNPDALGGLARAAKLDGNTALSNTYLERLRSINPNDPNIARVENLGAEQNQMAQLQQAAKLAESGQYASAMVIYRQVFGANPPPGDWSLAYYETESATEDGRPHSIAGLRALVEKYPADPRYQIALGRILTYNPNTREEGRKFLDRYPKDPQAVEALRQSYLWDSANPAMAGRIKAFLDAHPDVQLNKAMLSTKAAVASAAATAAAQAPSRPPSAAVAAARARSAAEIAAYKALNTKHIDEAEAKFKAILASEPENPKALAGMGYVRMQQGNFSGAISFLEQAAHDNSTDKGLAAALDTSRFWFIMGEGQTALDANDLTGAEKQYRAALALRPNSPDALAGLGGTLEKAQQPAAAIPIFAQYIKVDPAAPGGWRGLFLAEVQSGNAPTALANLPQIPAPTLAELNKDPIFLQTLASAYSDVGRDADAQKTLESALDLPFPADSKAVKADTQLQFAAILVAANRLDQAAGLYRQVLAADHANTAAWQGLVRVEHAMGHDPEALQTVESMPPANYEAAMRDPGFETTVASIYQADKKLDVAQDLLEKAIAAQTTAGQKPTASIELQLGGIYLERGDAAKAYPILEQVLADNPNRPEAWAALLAALHSTGRDKEAVAQVQLIPRPVRAELENNIDFLQTMSSVYSALGQSQEASIFLARVQQHYAALHTAPPAGIDIQNAWLLYNGLDDTGLYRQLMTLGDRPDLTEDQRRTVQTIWTNWAVRRANQATAAGNPRRALAILNAAARSFPDNPAVLKALANGYARAGQPNEAVLIFKAQNMSSASAADYESAVGAALAAGDAKDAETWLRFALTAYPSDPQVLILAAKFEQSRGDSTKAIAYYHASLKAMPTGEPGTQLAAELNLPAPSTASHLPSVSQSQDLSTLLAPGADPTNTPGPGYLPSYGNVYGQAPMTPTYAPGADTVPPYMTNPIPPSGPSGGRLKDYVPPQSRLDHRSVNLPSQPEVELLVRTAIAQVLDAPAQPGQPFETATPSIELAAAPAAPVPRDTSPAPKPTTSAETSSIAETSTPQTFQQSEITRLTEQAATQPPPPPTLSPVTASSVTPPAPATPEPIDYHTSGGVPTAVPVQLGDNTPHPEPPPIEITDVIPASRPLPNARANPNAVSTHPDIAAAQAAEVRRHQSDTAPLTGVSVRRTPPPSPAPADATPEPITTLPPTQPTTSAPAMNYPNAAQPLSGQPYPLIGPPYPLSAPPSDAELMARNLPPLRGTYDPNAPPPLTPRQQAENDLASLEGSYSGWAGGTGIGRYRSGTPGLDRLYDLEAPVELSTMLGRSIRLTVVPKAVFLNSGTLNTSTFATYAPNTVPYLGTLPANAANPPAQQLSNGLGGELQLTTRNLALAGGYTPYEFLVRNITGRFRWRPAGGHFTLFGERDSVKDTQLSYAGLRDPGTVSPTYAGTIWGGVIATTGGLRIDLGSNGSGFYVSGDGGVLRGDHVLSNTKVEGSMGAYFRVKNWPEYGSLTLGGSLFGMHYAHNELGLTYGLGGYFSPNNYFLASVPLTFNGHYGDNLHYVISGAVGVQTFQQDGTAFFPLDPALQSAVQTTLACTIPQLAAHNCGYYPLNGNTGFNYTINSEVSYRYHDHWYMGGFVSGNNTNNYNTVSGGFFFRYVFRKQQPSEGYPTGLFPVEGFRPLQVP